MKINYSLYLVTDRKTLKNKTLAQVVEEAIKAGVTIVQLREKNISYKEFKTLALSVRNITKKYGVPLIINDNVDLAIDISADGVHLGQMDNFINVKQKFKNGIIGISASTIEEARKALKESPDYLGIGSFFRTTTKHDAMMIDQFQFIDLFKKTPVPIVAIGGITKEKISILKKINIKNFAISSAILNDENKIMENTTELKKEI